MINYLYPKGALSVVSKLPTVNNTKTRLQAYLPNSAIQELQQSLLSFTLTTAHEATLCPVMLYYENFQRPYDFAQLPHHQYTHYKPQPQGDLGKRLQTLCETILQAHDFILLIGSDCPVMTSAYLQQAAHELMQQNKDVVLGAAEDGGYVLLGMKQYHPLFENIAWSSEKVFAQTLAHIKHQQLTYSLLPTLWDIDTPTDYFRYQETLQGVC